MQTLSFYVSMASIVFPVRVCASLYPLYTYAIAAAPLLVVAAQGMDKVLK